MKILMSMPSIRMTKPADGAVVPTARNLTEGKKVRAFIQSVPESDPDSIYVGLNDRDPAWHDLYKVKISTGEKTLISGKQRPACRIGFR